MSERYCVPNPKPARRERKARKPLPRVHQGGKRRRVPEALQRYRKLEKQADKLWSFIVKFSAEPMYAGDFYCACGCYRIGSDAHHIFTREKKPTRWILDNGIFLARGCHRRVGADHSTNRELGIRLLGQQRYDELDVMAHRPTKTDPALMIVALRQEIKDRGLEAQARARGLLG